VADSAVIPKESSVSDEKKLRNWAVLESRTLLSAEPFFSVRAERVALPDGREVADYYQIDLAPFVCIFAETEDGRILVIRQYKHGARRVSLTFPGGAIEAGEAAYDAARRELREETGYEAGRWVSLGEYANNANQGCGRAHLFIAKECRQVCQPESGDLEEMQVMAMHLEDIMAAAKRGEFVLLNQFTLLSLATHPDLLAALAEEVNHAEG
jgi:ADP-ribose pyrophosphatase